ncbi:MAG: DUF2971 domain-containing protein [Arcobacteraceae bacterium]
MEQNLLYHYTNIHACYSILQKKSIWMTDCRFLNDTKELTESIKLFIRPFNEEEKKILNNTFIYNSFNRSYCIFSLSKEYNVLSQWRAYANDARGVTLGFNKNVLGKLGFSLVNCIYEEHEEVINSMRKKHFNNIKDILDAKKELVAENSFMGWLRENYSKIDEIVYDLLSIKNIAFKEENEVRIIKPFDTKELNFRESNNKIIPYKDEIYWKESHFDLAVVIPTIWLGPKCNILNSTSLRMISRITEFKKYDCGYT